jgi:hypothetical protein
MAASAAAVLGLAGCMGAAEPSEGEMKQAVQNYINQDLGANGTGENAIDAKISEFKKGTCQKPDATGVTCTFTLKADSSNPAAATLLNSMSSGQFIKDKGKWTVKIG